MRSQARRFTLAVDSFQGQERGISVITLTRSNTQGEIGFLSDIRRMNVGMTRARRKQQFARWLVRLFQLIQSSIFKPGTRLK